MCPPAEACGPAAGGPGAAAEAVAPDLQLIVTRPAEQAGPWVQALCERGLRALALPLIAIGEAPDPRPVQAAWARLAEFRLVMFVSANAVRAFFGLRPAALHWPPATLAGSTGPGTSAALRALGVDGDRLVEPAADASQFDSEALWSRIAHRSWAGERALVVRGEQGRDWLADTLRGRGAVVEFVAAYRRLPPQLDAGGQAVLRAALDEPRRHLWLFSSSEAIARLQALAPAAGWAQAQALASHPRIAEAARGLGFGRVEQVAPSPDAVLDWVRRQGAGRGPSIQSRPAPTGRA